MDETLGGATRTEVGATGTEPRRAPTGVISSLVTPFRPDGQVDRGARAALLDLQAERGVHGLFLVDTQPGGVVEP